MKAGVNLRATHIAALRGSFERGNRLSMCQQGCTASPESGAHRRAAPSLFPKPGYVASLGYKPYFRTLCSGRGLRFRGHLIMLAGGAAQAGKLQVWEAWDTKIYGTVAAYEAIKLAVAYCSV